MNAVTDADALLAAIRDEPDSDELRFILADALEDAGDHGRAEFVRVSLELAAIPRCRKRPGSRRSQNCRCPACCHATLAYQLAIPLRIGGVIMRTPEWPFEETGTRPGPDVFGVWRGLPDVWAVKDVASFEAQAADVFGKWPIRRVVLRCDVGWQVRRDPYPPHDPGNGLAIVPQPVFSMLSGWRTPDGYCVYDAATHAGEEAIARADIEACLLKHGRSLVGLPPL